MGNESVSYKCPNCRGPLAYTPGQGDEITCEYCETKFSVADLDKLFATEREMAAKTEEAKEQKWEAEKAGGSWDPEEAAILRAMTCSSCGAELICDENTMATQCCYCGNATMVPGRFSGSLKPDYVIPFEKTKEDAVKAMDEFCKGKFLLPKDFTASSRVEKIQGMYVPFWLFDADVEGRAQYSATNSRVWDDGDNTITETDHFCCTRGGTMSFYRVPVDGSEDMDNTFMQSIEPYDYSKMVPFTTTYLAGYVADKYDVDAQAAIPDADNRIRQTTAEVLYNSVNGFDTVSQEDCAVAKESSSVAYAMAPVWIVSNKYKGEVYTFMMNGQTGKFVGSLPVDYGKGKRYSALAALISLPVTYYIGKFIASLFA